MNEVGGSTTITGTTDLNPLLVAVAAAVVGAAVVGAACGWLVRWGSVRLAKLEGLEPGTKPWQRWGPVIASALVLAAFGYQLEAPRLLLLHGVR